MREITEITIQNFQSHTKTIIKPARCGNLTALVGASNCGKTAVLRALRWLFYNTPQGTDFIRIGTGSSKVTVTYNDGVSVTRERGKSFNRYIITRNAQDQVFEGFGSSVPLEVQEVTGIKPVQVGDLSLNLNMSEQLEGPFLGKSISAGARAKVLGKLAGTEEIDLANKTLGTDIYRRNQDVKRLNSEVGTLEENIKQFDWLPTVAEKIEKIEALLAQAKVKEELKQKLVALQYQLGKVDREIELVNEVLQKWLMLPSLQTRLLKTEADANKQSSLKKLSERFTTCELGIVEAEKVIARRETLNMATEYTNLLYIAANRKVSLEQLCSKIAFFESQLREVKRIVARKPSLEQAGNLVDKALADVPRLAELKNKKLKYGQTVIQLNNTREICDKFKTLPEAEKKSLDLDALIKKSQQIKLYAGKKEECETGVRRAEQVLTIMKNELETSLKEYTDKLQEVGVCPLCGNNINPEKVKEAI